MQNCTSWQCLNLVRDNFCLDSCLLARPADPRRHLETTGHQGREVTSSRRLGYLTAVEAGRRPRTATRTRLVAPGVDKQWEDKMDFTRRATLAAGGSLLIAPNLGTSAFAQQPVPSFTVLRVAWPCCL